MKFHAIYQGGLKLAHEIQHCCKLRLVIQTDRAIFLRKLIAKQSLNEIHFSVNQCGRRSFFALGPNIRPKVPKKPNVLNEFLFTASFGRRSDYETTRQTVAVVVNDSF